MATLNSKITISSSDMFSQKLNLSTSTSSHTCGDDRAMSVERVGQGLRETCTLTVVETSLSNLNNKTLIFTDPYDNVHHFTFKSDYHISEAGNGSAGSITITSSTLGTWYNKTLIIIDNQAAARTVTITFKQDTTALVRNASTSTAIAYEAGLSGLTSIEAIRNKLQAYLYKIYQNGDISVIAGNDSTNTALLLLKQTIVGAGGNTTITGTVEGSVTTHVDFVDGGLGHTSSYIGIAGNSANATSHAKSLWKSMMMARKEKKLMIDPGDEPTTAVLTLKPVGPYKDTELLKPTGTAVTAGEVTVTTFLGGDVPTVFPCGEFDSKPHRKVYVYMVNKNNKLGTVNIYVKDSTVRSKGTITASGTDTSAIAAGKTIIIPSAKGLTYTLTSVASDSTLAAERVSDLAYNYREADTFEETAANIIETLELINNIDGREKKPFVGSLDSNLILSIKATTEDGGSSNNVAISGTLEGEGMITAADLTGGIDKYHQIARLEPGEFMFIPLAGNPKLYADAEDAVVEVEYLTLEK